jgi:hypothetical protein
MTPIKCLGATLRPGSTATGPDLPEFTDQLVGELSWGRQLLTCGPECSDAEAYNRKNERSFFFVSGQFCRPNENAVVHCHIEFQFT